MTRGQVEACRRAGLSQNPGVEFSAYAVIALGAYLLGSVPTGYLAAKAKGIDIRTVGSGNIGATNVFRILGKPAGITVLIIDMAKGFLACWLAGRVSGSDPELQKMAGGLFAILGHNYTCWLRFKGGKGVATTAGVLAALTPGGFGIAVSVFLIVFAVSKYVSMGSICAAAALPVAVWLTNGSTRMILLAAFIGAMAIYKHRSNIQRLMAGTENKIGGKKA